MVPVKISIGCRGVTADHPLAVKVGLDILEDGGNAFDAAISVSAVLSVVQPQMSGPGGDGFILGFINDEVIAYSSSGRSPSGFDAGKYLEKKPTRGPLTVTIPGLVHLWGHLYEEYASMPLDKLLKPAIDLACNGFNAGWFLSNSSRSYEEELSGYEWRRYFKGVKLGDLIVNTEMARTLKLISSNGWREFYDGKLTEEMVSQLQNQGVDVSSDDFKEHRSVKVKPLKAEVYGRTLYELPPNAQGVSTLQLISALHELDMGEFTFGDKERIEAWSEPVEKVYKFRDEFLGDPTYMNVNVEDYVAYSSLEAFRNTKKHGENPASGGDTTFFIVSDSKAFIGFIQSLFQPFGSGLIVGGFPVQNRGAGFAKDRGLPNSPAPRKQPLHTLSILAVEDGDDKYIIGCVGGDIRPQLHLRVYENIFIYGMNPAEAVGAPRFVYTMPRRAQRVVVEEPLKSPSSKKAEVFQVQHYGSSGHVHVAVINKAGRTILTNDPRSEGIALATK
ncbi:MAG: gamma-glutamyltransferase family protein [Candidatus Bathyarchaeia archaeon]